MSEAIVLDEQLNRKETIALNPGYADIHSYNFYLYVKAVLASVRANSAHTKNRANIRGGGKKPWPQKGLGRARAGSTRSPIFVGGAITFGPSNNKNYFKKVNKKQVVLALKFVINQKASTDRLYIVDDVKVESGKTKDAAALVKKFEAKDVLFIVSHLDDRYDKTFQAFMNLQNALFVEQSEVDPYLLSAYDSVVMARSVFDSLTKED